MKTLIRKGVFETNSSSSHTISLATEDKQFVLDTIYPDQHGVIRLTGGEFGWDWFKHNDTITKANYSAVDFQNNEDALEMLSEVIKEQTGASEIVFNIDGYIDHDSVGLVPRNKEDLKNFIFNKNSWLFGGNDNSTPDPTFYHVPEIKDGKIIVPEYKYELSVEGLDKTTKYLNNPTKEELEDGVESLLSHRLMNDDGTFLDLEDTTNIFFQINRRRDMFEKSYWVKQDYSKGYVIMTKENSVMPFESKLKENGIITEDMNWEKKQKTLTKEILKDKNIAKKIKFTLKEI